MTYQYKFIPAAVYAGAKKGITPKDQYIGLFQQTLNEQFYNSSNWWTIQEEQTIGQQDYQNIDVRISHVINSETGLKLGDDWKTLYFQDVNYPIKLGKYYQFDNSTWLVINIETVKNLTGTCTIRRCNNTLRWIDEPTGAYYTEPCIIEYEVKEPRDYITQGSPFPTPGGFLHIYTQLNDRTNLINENQRFLFGNEEHWTGYKVIGTGLNDFRNTNTTENDSSRILTIDVIANFVNDELDDIVNGIADVNTNVYVISLNTDTIEGSIGNTYQLTAYVTYNGDNVTRNITWESNDTTIATVSSSGIVTFVANGICNITAALENNTSYYDTCVVTVTSTPVVNSEIVIDPNTNYILEGNSRAYSVYLYENNVLQADTFTITCNGNSVPSTSYTFTQTDDNHFEITNILRDIDSYLTISCVTGALPAKTFDVYLRGAWQFDST